MCSSAWHSMVQPLHALTVLKVQQMPSCAMNANEQVQQVHDSSNSKARHFCGRGCALLFLQAAADTGHHQLSETAITTLWLCHKQGNSRSYRSSARMFPDRENHTRNGEVGVAAKRGIMPSSRSQT